MTELTLKRIDTLALVEGIADEALALPPADRRNIFHSLAQHIGAIGAGRAEIATIAAYAIALLDDLDG